MCKGLKSFPNAFNGIEKSFSKVPKRFQSGFLVLLKTLVPSQSVVDL